VVLLALAGAAVALAWTSPIPPVSPPEPASFDRTTVARGEALSHLGNCRGCHTTPHGEPFAGGRALPIPFGTIFVTNITPDRETGIGAWSLQAFARAMRQGVARNGEFLYPAFPYDHFTRASDDDLAALYAFLMTRPAVKAMAPANRLRRPVNWRRVMTVWNLAFLRPGPLAEDPVHTAAWNRGRALAEGLAHCGACHTPRNEWGAGSSGAAYDGAWAEGWYAPPLNAHSPALKPWTEDQLFTYLTTGLSAQHASAAGPMNEVTRELAQAAPEDVRAIAAYVASLMAEAPAHRGERPLPDKPAAAASNPAGAVLFAGACAACHAPGAPMMQQGRPALALGTSLNLETPHDVLHVIVQGLPAPAARSTERMPAFGEIFSDEQLAEIAGYLRARFTDQPPWPNLPQAVREVRGQERGSGDGS
jgi:nicotinate dehydrogenase subunit B